MIRWTFTIIAAITAPFVIFIAAMSAYMKWPLLMIFPLAWGVVAIATWRAWKHRADYINLNERIQSIKSRRRY